MGLTLTTELSRLHAVNRVYQELSTQLDGRTLLKQFAERVRQQFGLPRVVILTFDAATASLEYGSVVPPLPDRQTQMLLEMVLMPTLSTSDDVVTTLKQGDITSSTGEHLTQSRLAPLQDLLPNTEWVFAPLCFDSQWLGLAALVIESPLSDEDRQTLREMCEAAARLLHNANRYMRLAQESEKALNDMQTFQQIDAELNDTIELPYVFRMIIDWALRFTRADTAIMGLYDESADAIEIVVQYGYTPEQLTVGQVLKEEAGITRRVARLGRAEVIPDVSTDTDYYPTAPQVRSMLAVPIMREERVVAVMTLESSKLNAFTEDHLTFALKLANRAGVSIHNARLFSETRREKHKLALILSHITDLVIVLDTDQRVVMLNHAAMQVFGLDEQRSYEGDKLVTLIPHDSPLIPWLAATDDPTHPKETSVRLLNGRIYDIIMTQHSDIGQMIVLQDVTYYKEMDQLKSELVTTVTHDLKQPLSIMRGYLDLLGMVSSSHDERTKRYVSNLEHAFSMMRQLIDDLLDMAQIEEGIQLSLYPITLNDIVRSCVASFSNVLEQREMTLTVDLPTLPLVEGDIGRLTQVFQNLISNAIKYTPPKGTIRIFGESSADSVLISIQDSGIGISPEDQARIFERFFRVRNTQTAKIEGTGLGLAIVQSLVHAHKGTIRVESERDEGSTFKVSLPIYKAQHVRQQA